MGAVPYRLLAITGVLAAACTVTLVAQDRESVHGTKLYVSNGGHVECHCVEVVRDEASREAGLSPDGDPAPFAAMAFTWSEPAIPGFWMKNTAGRLQVAFSDSEGVVSQTGELEACDEDGCPAMLATMPTQLVIEAPELQKLGIVTGSLLTLGDECEVPA